MTRTLDLAARASLLASAAIAQASADDFPAPRDTEPDRRAVMPADVAAASFQMPEGFRVSVFAAEPEVRNPIGMAWDARGRLWVAENYTYAERTRRFDLSQRDRVLIFEDRDGDGTHDRRSVFTDRVQMLTSVETGRGGVFLMCPPQLLFVPDRDGDDVPDAEPVVLLDGFTVPAENYHNFANGLRWGPDGWLYGRCGASAPGTIGVPGAAAEARVPLHGGLWRFHPDRKAFEALTHGTTNPWGHDWNAMGEAFFINTVNGHLWHAIAGAHFVRPHTVDPNPRAYRAIDQHADHWHWDTAKDWSDSRSGSGEHGLRGGGHAHSGLMIYQGDDWPEADRGTLFTLNFHGRRMNAERLDREGGGYVGRHEPDRFFAGDPWFRGIDLGYGPDGGVFVLDWSDTGECHDSTGVHRNSGRIYKFTRGPGRAVAPFDLAKLDADGLAALQGHQNEWFARMGRRLLAEKVAGGADVASAAATLKAMLADDPDVARKLRALWTLSDIGSADDTLLTSLLRHDHEAVRAWAIRLLTDSMPLDTVLSRRIGPDRPLPADRLAGFAGMARDDPSALVRLVLTSTLQRLPLDQRAALAEPLLGRAEDAGDHNIPLLAWYALIPVADADPSGLARLGAACALPTTRRLIARRLAEDLETNPGPVDLLLRAAASGAGPPREDVLAGLAEGLRGWRKARKPAAWDAFAAAAGSSEAPGVRDALRDLGVLFGDGRALGDVTRLALDDAADLETRRSALETLIAGRAPDLRPVCERLLRVRHLNRTAARGLTLFDDPEVGRRLAESYPTFHPSDRPAILDTLASRPAFARVLLDRVASGKIPRGDVSAFHARQVRSLGDDELTRRLAEVWGEARDTPQAKREAMATWRSRLTPEVLGHADRARGRLLFAKSCGSCHKLYGQGGEIGPDLTGSGRDNLDYLLENVVDPSAVVGADFRMSVVATADGRVLNGLIRDRTDRTLTVRTQDVSVTLEHREVEEVRPSPLSLMPEGILDTLAEDEARDLIGYLMQRSQAPLPGG